MLLTATTAAGAVYQIPALFEGSTKVCTIAGSGAAAEIDCTLTIGPLTALPVGETLTVTITGDAADSMAHAVFLPAGVDRAAGGCLTTNPAGITATSFFLTTAEVCSGFDVITVTERLTVTEAGGGPLCQRIGGPSAAPVVVCATTPADLPFTVPAPQTAPVTFTASCTASDTTVPAGSVRAGRPLTCVVTVTAASEVPPATATVTLVHAAFDQAGTTTMQFPCGDVAAGTACTTFTDVLYPTTACVTPTQTVQLSGLTFTLPVAGPDGAALIVLPQAGTAGACSGPAVQFPITCTSSTGLRSILDDAVLSGIPGEIGGTYVSGVGILPEAILCRVRPADAAGRMLSEGVPPGSINVSSTHGTLLDAGGRLTTTLRLPCGAAAGRAVPDEAPPSPCTGVQFTVAGLGVGMMEVRARYLPGTAAAAAGVAAAESRAVVGFVAPLVRVDVDVAPELVAVGQRGAVVARLNGAARVCDPGPCVDPTTGLPIIMRAGSVLNGAVVFTLDDPVIAVWMSTAARPSPATQPVPDSGPAAGAGQTVRRCGPRPTRSSGRLSAFFGGCRSVAAVYQGLNPGAATVTATFVPDLPGAFGRSVAAAGVSLPANLAALAGLFTGAANPTAAGLLEVVDGLP